MVRWLVPLLVGALGASLAGSVMPEVDRTREARVVDEALVFVPDGPTMRIAATGQEEPLSDLFWVRAVLTFGERWEGASGSEWTTWLRAMVISVTDLDPLWRTPYFWGGMMLRVAGDIDGSDRVFQRGAAALPNDPFFPFSLAMNAWLYREDDATAAELAGRAATLPGAPAWYAGASAAFRARSGDRRAAIRYLKETLEATTSEALRQHTERQLRRMLHDELVDGWAGACRAWWTEHGAPLQRPEDITKLGFSLPENPRGDAWIVGRDGVVRSEGAETERVRRRRMEEFALLH